MTERLAGVYEVVDQLGGTLLDYRHAGRDVRAVTYASVTARPLTRVEVILNDEVVDVVFAGNGGSHSWWGVSGGAIVPSGSLQPKDHLVVKCDAGPCALRVD